MLLKLLYKLNTIFVLIFLVMIT